MARLGALAHAPITLTPCSGLLEAALTLSTQLRHPVYDCLYLALALRRNLPVITADRRFALAVGRHKDLAPNIRLLGR